MIRRLTAVLVAFGALAAIAAAPALAAPSVSSNWAGYAAIGARFSHVAGYWTAPAATCTPGQSAYSAFWVGIGGYSTTSSGLEQIGTDSDCTRSGSPVYSAWYELVPAAPVTIRMRIAPGDVIKAAVGVRGRSVVVQLRDVTSGAAYSRRLSMSRPDLGSAEWIAEAPSLCDDSGNCSPLPLADFGTVGFSGASATNAAGHVGAISDPRWAAVEIELQGDRGSRRHGSFGTLVPSDATPTALSAAGDAFSVSWLQAGQQEQPPGAPVQQQPTTPANPSFSVPARRLQRG